MRHVGRYANLEMRSVLETDVCEFESHPAYQILFVIEKDGSGARELNSAFEVMSLA